MIDYSELKDKRVLIVGGAGFIGHNLALKLKTVGAIPSVLDGLQVNNLGYYTSSYADNPNAERYISFINERLELLRSAEVGLHVIDARDYHLLSREISAIKPDVVIHLAAVSHANRSNKDPFSTFDHSMRTLENVLDAIRDTDAHLIYFSSSMVYGNFDGEVVEEDRACNPMGIYGALKYGSEKLVIAYNQVFGVRYTIIRPSALYGERCVSRRVGQAFIENALMGKDLTINGDGNEGLDFTYISDLMQGVFLAITKKEAINQIFNLTYGFAVSLNDLAKIVLSQFPDSKLVHVARDGLMPERGALSIEKARQLLGYNPENPVDVGFIKYINWYKDFALRHPKLCLK